MLKLNYNNLEIVYKHNNGLDNNRKFNMYLHDHIIDTFYLIDKNNSDNDQN